MATRQQLTNQANQAEACFVLNDFSDGPNTSSYLVGQNVPTEQIPLIPTASATLDVKNTATFDVHATND